MGTSILYERGMVLLYLKDFREETRANLLAEEVVDASQTGHGAP